MARKQQLQHPGVLIYRSVAVQQLLRRCSDMQRYRSVAVAGSGALQWPGSSRCSAQECFRSGAVAREQQLQRPGALQERCSGDETAVAATWSVTGLLLWGKKQEMQRLGAS